MRRRLAIQAFVCGAVWGIAIGMAAIAGGGPAMAALLMAAGVGGFAVLILGARMGALRRRADRVEDMLGAVSAGLVVLDRNETCVATGGMLHGLLGMPEEWDPTGRNIGDILAELAARGDFGPRLRPGEPVDPALLRSGAIEDIYIETPRGRVLAVAVSDLPDGGWVLTYTDMTEHKEQTRRICRAQRELALSEARARRLAREAEAANSAKSAFLAAMSHEIRTPMNGVLGMSDILAESGLTDAQREILETIRQSGESLLVIINDILDFSKIEAGQMRLEVEPFDLRATVEDVLKLVQPRAREQGIAVALDYQPGLAVDFVGDPHRLRQVMINLVGNAVKFTPQGRVTVRVRGRMSEPAADLEIAVEDTGIGIPQESLPLVFGEFSRVDRSNARRSEGTGLGLAISRRLIEMMEGEIRVESELGAGTIFTIRLTLPVAPVGLPGRHAAAAAVAQPSVPWGGRRLRVLMAEDNATNRIVATRMLADQPVDLVLARNGREAAELFDTTAPDVVLMDISMPEVDGFAATAAIRALEARRGLARTPIIALTASAMEGDRERCLDADMDDYLSKPLRKAELVGLIRAHGTPVPKPEWHARAAG